MNSPAGRAQGCGVFLREGSGRVVSSETGSAKIPEEMLEHMKYLFKAFDTDDSGVSFALVAGVDRLQNV